MQLSEAASGSGLLIAEEPASASEIGALLREHEPRLRLVPQMDEARRCLLWQVWYDNGPDRSADYVCSWATADGEPLPLGSQLVEKVKLLDRRTSGDAPDHKRLNERHQARIEKDKQDRFGAVEDDHRAYIDRGRRSVSMGPRSTRQPADHI